MQLEVKTILNRIQHFSGFVYQDVRLRCPWRRLRIEMRIEPHQNIRPRCSMMVARRNNSTSSPSGIPMAT